MVMRTCAFGQLENPYLRNNGISSPYNLFDDQQQRSFYHWITNPISYNNPTNCSSIAPMQQLILPEIVSMNPPYQKFGQAVLLLGLNVLSRGSIAPSFNADHIKYYAPRYND
jgi:hypothetical protein